MWTPTSTSAANHRKARAEELPDHRGRLHHVRAADAAMGGRRHVGDHQHRRLRAAANTVMQRQGRPGALSAGPYYPLHEDERSTGFLMPMYGTSTFRGHSLSNAFFWAINRSQDATFFHDWFTKTGTGAGASTAIVSGTGSSGQIRAYRLDQKATVLRTMAGRPACQRRRATTSTPPCNQTLADGLRARATSTISATSSRSSCISRTSTSVRRPRLYLGGVTGAWNDDRSAAYDRAPRVHRCQQFDRLRLDATALGQPCAVDALRHADLLLVEHRYALPAESPAAGRRGHLGREHGSHRHRAGAARAALAAHLSVGDDDAALSRDALFDRSVDASGTSPTSR